MEHSQVIYCHFEVATSFLDMFLVIVWWWKSLHPTKGPFFRWVGWHKCWKSSAMLHPEMSRSGSQRYAKPLHLPETNNYIWLHYVIMNNRMPPKIWKPLNLLNHSIYLWSICAPFPTLCCLWQTANPPRPRCICAHWNRSDQPFVRCEKNVFHLLTWNPLFTHAPWRIRAREGYRLVTFRWSGFCEIFSGSGWTFRKLGPLDLMKLLESMAETTTENDMVVISKTFLIDAHLFMYSLLRRNPCEEFPL